MSQNLRTSQSGSARLKFILVMAVIVVLAYVGYMLLPVLYQAYLFKDLMQHDVDVASAQGYQPSWVKDQLVKSAPEYNVPPDALINPSQRDNRIECTVQFTKAIEFPGYTYQYEFDHTVKSTEFLTIK